MKSAVALVTILFASVNLNLLAQQSPSGDPVHPAATSPAAATPNNPSGPPEIAAGPMSPVSGELESKLDSKTAKVGDNVVVRTKSTVKIADGTEIPKGSKLVGHVTAVQPSEAGKNSQVVLQFNQVELRGGQSIPVHSQIRSIASSGSAVANGGSDALGGEPSSMPSQVGPSRSTSPGGMTGASRASEVPNATSGAASEATVNGPPAVGTVVAKNGNIAIQTTSIPGVLLANNAPGQQDPRMANASSILLGAKKDIQLDSGTQIVVAVSASGGGAQ